MSRITTTRIVARQMGTLQIRLPPPWEANTSARFRALTQTVKLIRTTLGSPLTPEGVASAFGSKDAKRSRFSCSSSLTIPFGFSWNLNPPPRMTMCLCLTRIAYYDRFHRSPSHAEPTWWCVLVEGINGPRHCLYLEEEVWVSLEPPSAASRVPHPAQSPHILRHAPFGGIAGPANLYRG